MDRKELHYLDELLSRRIKILDSEFYNTSKETGDALAKMIMAKIELHKLPRQFGMDDDPIPEKKKPSKKVGPSGGAYEDKKDS